MPCCRLEAFANSPTEPDPGKSCSKHGAEASCSRSFSTSTGAGFGQQLHVESGGLSDLRMDKPKQVGLTKFPVNFFWAQKKQSNILAADIVTGTGWSTWCKRMQRFVSPAGNLNQHHRT